jgi:predicted DNA-binding protein
MEEQKMNDRVFSIRLPEDEYHALKAMVRREERTANSWLRSRIVREARNLQLLDNGQAEVNHNDMPQEDIPLEYYTPPAYEELEL